MSWGGVRISKEDRKFSILIRSRANGQCDYCLKPKRLEQMECSHFHGRRKKSVRWNPANAASLCKGCHRHLGENPLLHTEFFKKRLGEASFNLLTIKANMPASPDLQLINIWLDEELKQHGKFIQGKWVAK